MPNLAAPINRESRRSRTYQRLLVGWCTKGETYEEPYTGPKMYCSCWDYDTPHCLQKRLMYICEECLCGYFKKEDFVEHHHYECE